ncbi:hypothetical protein [Roseateles noduli]|uniref:hypothetical protein n=1 Tax=Roseateles noduli TaxID=2052484 RepID=UPI003D64ED41
MTYDLKLPKPEENRATLALFWETAQPLKHVVAELPDISNGHKMNIKPVFPRSALVPGASPVDLLNASVSSELELVFPNLPEPLFERLALRFRPFYANDEEVNFLKLLNFVSQLNSDLHPWKKERKASWDRAVFWGAMGMPEQKPAVKAEDVIKAGLYSRYFHVNKVHREKALAYEKSLGVGMYRIALVSSVWQRSNVVLQVANEMEQLLVNLGIVTAEAVEAAKTPAVQPEEVSFKIKGGPGAFQAEVIEKP